MEEKLRSSRTQNDSKRKIVISLILLCLILVAIPSIVILLTSISLIPADCDNAWIGFWGSYLGAIVGGVITLYVLQKTIKANNDNLERTLSVEKERELDNKKERLCDDICEKLLSLSIDAVNDIRYRISQDGLTNVKTDTAKNVLVTFTLVEAKLKSKLDDPRYKKCDILIEATKVFQEEYNDCIKRAAKNERTVAWIPLDIEFMDKSIAFHEKVKEFYISNLD